jgi:hypothetical protein
MDNPFLLKIDNYKRNLSQYDAYCKDAALYLSKTTGDSFDQCLQYVKKVTGKEGKFAYKDPVVDYLVKETDGNRTHKQTTLSKYLKAVNDNRFILSPTLTAYYHPDDKPSVLAEYIQGELNNRSTNKKLMLAARDRGDSILDNIYNNRQQRNKIKCNSLSGAHGTPSSVLFNQSAHSTLTSTCRSASSNTNANIERFLSGNRHYWSVDMVINNICSILNLNDISKVVDAVNYYNLKLPTIDQVMTAIKRCTDLYWNDDYAMARVRRLVSGLTPYERAAFYYNGDMYNLRLLNEDLVRDLYSHLAVVATETIDNPMAAVKALNGDEVALIGIVCSDELKYKKLFSDEVVNGDKYGIIGATAAKMKQGISKYSKLIEALWVTPSIPASMASFPSSMRRSVVASDTDSCLFTNQEWCKWWVGELKYCKDAVAAAAATTYLCSQLTVHVLAVMSGNLGVADRHLRTLEMKNEYLFPVFSLTTMAKHYWAAMLAQEGNVYKELHWEIKGATLRNSKAPVAIVDRADDLIKEIVDAIMRNEKINLLPIVREVADKELEIIRSLKAGSSGYYSTGQIKLASSYGQGEKSPMYQCYSLWNEVFGPKYGTVAPPPYNVIKVSLDTDSKAKMNMWLNSMTDKELAARFKAWLFNNGKENVTTIWLPMAEIKANGIPEELLERMNTTKMVISIMRNYYMILECLGYYTLNKRTTRLVSDDLNSELQHRGVA